MKYNYNTNRLKKYNQKDYFSLKFNKTGLDNISKMYKNNHGVPEFLNALLHLSPKSKNIEFLKKTNQIVWSEEGDIAIFPDHFYCDDELLIKDPKNIYNKPRNFELGAWFIHPKILENTVFFSKQNRTNFKSALSSVTPTNPKKEKSDAPHPGPTQAEIEKESGKKYLSSVLDLTEEDLPYLREMKKLVMKQLRETYGISKHDKVEMYFNSLVANDYSTLHLHVTVNQQSIAINKNLSMRLDDVITNLENGITPKDVLEKRGQIFFVDEPRYNSFKPLDGHGLKLDKLKNPYYHDTNNELKKLQKEKAITWADIISEEKNNPSKEISR